MISHAIKLELNGFIRSRHAVEIVNESDVYALRHVRGLFVGGATQTVKAGSSGRLRAAV
ncbi:hypothetical protein DE4587_02706 [Mycobacteroides salmoniphilum]|nr:hypothetical protein DE4586_03164 [Mycobacteroides salmoniphilum]TDZ83793.1 hypothetical protein DE4587_02706 [Mycobacteroides salmoniphilum]